jgi:hypothetical protein
VLARIPLADGRQVQARVQPNGEGDMVHIPPGTVMWGREHYVPAWLVPLIRLLSERQGHGARSKYVGADFLLAKKHRAAYESAFRLGGDDALLALRDSLLNGRRGS